MLRIHHAVILLALLVAVPAFADETVIPTGTDSSDSGTSCDASVHATIDDDPDAPGGDWCTADSDGTSWNFVVTLGTVTDTLDNTTDAQTIEFYVRSFDESATNDPTIQMEIYDKTTVDCDTLHESGTVTTLTDAGFPAKITDTWTSSGISNKNDVCVKIICTKAAGGPGARNSCDIDALEWDVVAAAGGRTRRTF